MSDTNNQLEINDLSLENFVYQTIIEITKGIKNATTELKESGTLINPATHPSGTIILGREGENVYRNVQKIEFDLTVSMTSEESKGAGMKINVLNSIRGNGNVGNNVTNIATNRLKFIIPISLPVDTENTKITSAEPSFYPRGEELLNLFK